MTEMTTKFLEVEYIYPLERIALIASRCTAQIFPLLNGFREFYDSLEIKPIDVSSFKKNNKSGNNIRPKNHSGIWKRKNKFRGKDIEKFLANAYIKQLPQNDEAKIRKIIISHLNKLNEKKFTIIVKEFIDNLEEQMFSETYNILNNEILNKVSTDTHYIGLYAKLIKELIINKKWQKKMFNIITHDEDSEKNFYWSLNSIDKAKEDEEYVGPFQSEDEALEDAMENNNYKISFCSFMESTFNTRQTYQNEIAETSESFDANLFSKNKYNNFLRFIFNTVKQGIFSFKILHHCLMMLTQTGELEQFAFLYESIHSNLKLRFNSATQQHYEETVNKVLTKVNISPKTKFKLQEFFKLKIKSNNMFDVLAMTESLEDTEEYSPVIKSVVTEVKTFQGDNDIECIISEYVVSEDYNSAKDLFKSISDHVDFNNKLIARILDAKEKEAKQLTGLTAQLFADFPKYSENFGSFVDGHLINLYADCEIDYPNSKILFADLIKNWLSSSNNSKDEFIESIKNKTSDDEDIQFNIDLFNEKVIVLL